MVDFGNYIYGSRRARQAVVAGGHIKKEPLRGRRSFTGG